MSTSGIVERSDEIAAAVERKSKDYVLAKSMFNEIHRLTGEGGCNGTKVSREDLNSRSESFEGSEWGRLEIPSIEGPLLRRCYLP